MSIHTDTNAEQPLPILPEPGMIGIRRFLWGTIILLSLSLVTMLVLFLLSVLHIIAGQLEVPYGISGAGVFLALISLYSTTIQRRSARLLFQKRQRAAQGDAQLLADTQPSADDQALVLPHIIALRYKRFTLLRTVGIYLLLVVFLTTLAFLSASAGIPVLTALALVLILPLDLLFLVIAGYFLLSVARPAPLISVTQESIQVRGGFAKPREIGWGEARLFAIINATTTNRRIIYPLTFELAGADKTLRFVWLRPELAKQNIFEPLTSYEEYNEQMQALLSVIAAKTGLPLYDLRKQMN